MIRRKKGRIGVIFGVFILVLAWAMSSALAETPIRGGQITVAVDVGPTGFDPHLSITTATRGFTEHIYETLLRYNYKMEVGPGLATSWKQLDPLTYIFHLRKGVKFHNGEEMTAEDVKFTFDRVTDPKLPLSAFDPVKNAEIVDKYTVKVNLKTTMPDFLSYCAFIRDSAIVPKDAVLKHGSLQKVQIGTGPFKLKEYKEGAYGIFVRNEDYWDRNLPYVDGFKLVVVKDEASRLAGLRKGTYDIGWVRGPQMATLAAKEPNLRMVKAAAARQGRFWLV
jgi:peptide/nickel transport system substrate-binding protein